MKKGVLFVSAYCFIMFSIIAIGIYYPKLDVPENRFIVNSAQTYETQSFDEALKAHEEKTKGKKETENPNRWKPSSAFVITAISIGAIADIIIVLLWARHENKKREKEAEANLPRKKSITDYSLFWWVIGLGMIKKEERKINC